jgi:hypothetical protein
MNARMRFRTVDCSVPDVSESNLGQALVEGSLPSLEASGSSGGVLVAVAAVLPSTTPYSTPPPLSLKKGNHIIRNE